MPSMSKCPFPAYQLSPQKNRLPSPPPVCLPGGPPQVQPAMVWRKPGHCTDRPQAAFHRWPDKNTALPDVQLTGGLGFHGTGHDCASRRKPPSSSGWAPRHGVRPSGRARSASLRTQSVDTGRPTRLRSMQAVCLSAAGIRAGARMPSRRALQLASWKRAMSHEQFLLPDTCSP